MILELLLNRFNESSPDHFKDIHKLKPLTNFDVSLSLSPGGVTNLTFNIQYASYSTTRETFPLVLVRKKQAVYHNILVIFARHFLQSCSQRRRVKAHFICGCAEARDLASRLCCFSLILCLFQTLLEGKPSALSCVQVQTPLYSINVFLQTW